MSKASLLTIVTNVMCLKRVETGSMVSISENESQIGEGDDAVPNITEQLKILLIRLDDIQGCE